MSKKNNKKILKRKHDYALKLADQAEKKRLNKRE